MSRRRSRRWTRLANLLGESRARALEWHLIGPVQSNKTRAAAERFDWVQSVDRAKIARRLSEQRPANLAPLNVLIEVNLSGETSKSGVSAEDAAELARAVAGLPRLRLRGLMAIPAPSRDQAVRRARFRAVRELFERLRAQGLALDTLSMGMSDDMEAAIAEGATMVRIGSAIFGARAKVRERGMKIAFLGGGNMAGALIGGLLAQGFDAGAISVVEVSAAARDNLAAQHNVRVSTAPDAATLESDTLVLAVKPQDMHAALASFGGAIGAKLVISIAAGLRLADLSRWLGGHRRLVRCMPNTPALIGAGITGLYALPEVSSAEKQRAARILGAVGEVVWVDEEALLDPVTAVSGSGPAYVFWFIEQLAAAGARLGLPPEVAAKLALQTVLGAARLAAQSGEAPGALRERVTSKGGTTEAALRVFDEERLAERLLRALEAASRRGAELGEELGKGD